MPDQAAASFPPLFVAELVLERLGPCGDALQQAGLDGPYYQLHRLEGCLRETIAELRTHPTLTEGGSRRSPLSLVVPTDGGDERQPA